MSRLEVRDADLARTTERASAAADRSHDHGSRASAAARSHPVGRGRWAHLGQEVVDAGEEAATTIARGVREVADDTGRAATALADDLTRADRSLAGSSHEAAAGHDPLAVRVPHPTDPPPIVPKDFHDPMDMVPPYATRERFDDTSDGRYGGGFAYHWVDEWNREIRIHGHLRDTRAPSDSHSRHNPIYRVSINGRFIDASGHQYHEKAWKKKSPHYDPDFARKTHIPWPRHVRMPTT